MRKVVRRPAALKDAVDIWVYIALRDIEAADRLTERIDRRIVSLADMPLTGQSRSEYGPELRSVTVGSYLILYEPSAEGIEIVRILHGARDVAREFRAD